MPDDIGQDVVTPAESDASQINRELWQYARGYLLSDQVIEPPVSLWKKARVGKYHLSYDPRCDFAQASEGDCRLAILGLAINTRSWSMEPSEVARDALAALIGGESKFLNFVDDLAGRFVIFYSDGERDCVMTDATNMRSTFYTDHPHPLIISSHATLIRELTGAGPQPMIDITWLDKYSKYCLPGHFTPYDGIYYLTPNTLLEMETREVRRFFPREELAERRVETVIDEISELYRRQIETVAGRFNPAISLSAGIDSRTTMAMSRTVSKRSLFFTYVVEHDPHHKLSTLETDQHVAQEITSNLGLRHLLIQVTNDDDPENLAPIQRGNSFLSHSLPLARAYARLIGENYIHIRSNLSEIATNRRRGGTRHGEMTPAHMAWRFARSAEAEKDPGVIRAFAAFFEKTRFTDNYNYDDYEMWYWEHKMGTWHPCVLLESDVAFDTFSPYNCRRLLKLLMSVSATDRMNLEVHQEIIRRNWPVLAFWPRNRIRTSTPMIGWRREAKQLPLDKAEVRAGALEDPNGEVGFTWKAVPEEAAFQLVRSNPRKGDFVSYSLPLKHEPGRGWGLFIQILSPYVNPQCRGYMAYQVLLDSRPVVEEDIALWRLPNSIQINWVPDKPESRLEVRVVALQDCKPWEWGWSSRLILQDVCLTPVEHKGGMEVRCTSPHSRKVNGRPLVSRLKRLILGGD